MAIGLGTTTNVAHSGAHVNDGNTVIYLVGSSSNTGVMPGITSATYGGVAMALDVGPNTIVFSGAERGAAAIFRLTNAPPGSNAAAATVSDPGVAWGYCFSLKSAAGAPLVASSAANASSANIASQPGGIAVAVIADRTQGVTPAYGLTEVYDGWDGGIQHGFAVGYEYTAEQEVMQQFGWDAVAAAGCFATYRAGPAGNQVILIA